MMENQKTAFFISLGIHSLLLGFFLFSVNWMTPKHPVLEASEVSPEPIRAITLSQDKLEKQIKAIKTEETEKKHAEETRVKRLEEKAKQAAAETSEEKQRLAELTEKRRKEVLEQQEEAVKAKQQLEKVQREQAAEKARLEKLKKQRQEEEIERQLRSEEAEWLAKEMQKEQQTLAAATANQADQSEIDKYTALITHAIGRHWIRPDSVVGDISCILFIRLSPNGEVLDVNLVTSSGDPLLDRSATAAVRKASPLPVPDSPELFPKFREIRLKVKPEGYLM
jgi:colicin import membrane protein